MLVYLTRRANRDLLKLPLNIAVKFEQWKSIVEEEGLTGIQKINGFRDHALRGDREGQRSSSLSRSWRVIYQVDHLNEEILVEVLEINKHEY
jgi:proteic killer suppression protein